MICAWAWRRAPLLSEKAIVAKDLVLVKDFVDHLLRTPDR
jgi:hypothetical protein